MRYCALILLVFLACSAHGQDWHTGVLVSVDSHQETDVIGGEQRNAGITWHLQVDIGDRILFVEDHFRYIWDHTPKLTVENAPIQWQNVKGKFVFLDEKGRKFTGNVVKQRMKTAPAVTP